MFLKKFRGREGFTLIEILVALFLVTLILAVILSTGGTFSSRNTLDEALDEVERAVRFSVDEAALQNRIVRILFLFEKSPQEYAVEYGPSDSFVLPVSAKSSLKSTTSVSDQEQIMEETKKIDQSFHRVHEFQENNKKIPDGVRIIGVGTSLTKELVADFQSSIYVYPSGEKDGAIIFLGTNDEVAAIIVSPFTMDIERRYVAPFKAASEEEIIEKQLSIAQEEFERWLNDRS